MPKTSKHNKSINTPLVILSLGFLFLSLYFGYKNWEQVKTIPNKVKEADMPQNNSFIKTYPRIVLQDLWTSYVDKFIQNDGRTIDKSSNLITTSEGQSYSLLKAVWIDDKETYDKVWKWTNVNLKKRSGDNLFAWKWGKKPEGDWGILEHEGGLNTASDADQDIALAMILAYYRWNDDYYLDQARRTLTDIWNKEVVIINDRPYLTAGNWADQPDKIIVNPSYYSLAAYPLFKQIDPVHDWDKVKDTSYEVLNSMDATLPPDWAAVSKTDLTVTPVGLNGKGIEFSHDALRVPWRVALDWKWHQDPRSLDYIEKLSVLKNEWEKFSVIREQYALNGTPLTSHDNLSMYGSLLPFMEILDPNQAERMLHVKISPRYDPDTGGWTEDLGYYDSNWLWFGLALYLESAVITTPSPERAI